MVIDRTVMRYVQTCDRLILVSSIDNAVNVVYYLLVKETLIYLPVWDRLGHT